MAGIDQLSRIGGIAPTRPCGGRGGIGVAVLVSAAAHLGLLGLGVGWTAQSTSTSSSVIVVVPPGRVEIRLADVQPLMPVQAGFEVDSSDVEARPLRLADVAIPADDPPQVLDDGSAAPLPDQTLASERDEQPAAAVDGYWPRLALSRGPVPIGEIDLPWPNGLLPSGRETGTFWVFIDETGVVRKFEADGPTLAPQLEEVARSSFLAARFEPGERDGQAVKSLIRIEVVFDNKRPDPRTATVVSQQIL